MHFKLRIGQTLCSSSYTGIAENWGACKDLHISMIYDPRALARLKDLSITFFFRSHGHFLNFIYLLLKIFSCTV